MRMTLGWFASRYRRATLEALARLSFVILSRLSNSEAFCSSKKLWFDRLRRRISECLEAILFFRYVRRDVFLNVNCLGSMHRRVLESDCYQGDTGNYLEARWGLYRHGMGVLESKRIASPKPPTWSNSPPALPPIKGCQGWRMHKVAEALVGTERGTNGYLCDKSKTCFRT